MWKSGFRAP